MDEDETRVCASIKYCEKLEINSVFILIEVYTDGYSVSGEWSLLLKFLSSTPDPVSEATSISVIKNPSLESSQSITDSTFHRSGHRRRI
jgi:hypothetical protein